MSSDMASTVNEKPIDKSAAEASEVTIQPDVVSPSMAPSSFKRDAKFWLIFGALCCCTLLSALDLGGIGTAGPTIVHDLHGSDFTWVASAYALSASVFIPLSGNLSQAFGRRLVILAGILIFGIGSAVSGSAHSLAALIIGRVIQGAGAGAIQALNSIILTDLVPLRERGVYAGVTGLVWTVGSASGPFISGGLTQHATWRWLFYLNLPLSGIAFLVVSAFLHLKKPEGNISQKIAKIDWFGNFLLMASTCSFMIALTIGGIRFPWLSENTLVPLILGICGLGVTILYESRFPKMPVIPLVVLTNRTSLSGYVGTFIQGMVTLGIGFYLPRPSWFQSVKSASPVASGLYFLPLAATISPSAIAQGIIVSKTGFYRTVNLVGWVITVLGVALLITLKQTTSIGLVALYQILMGIGLGFLYSTTFPVLAPLPLSENTGAMALLVFLRQFSQAWGVAIGGTILQNTLKSRLPDEIFTDKGISNNGQLAYAIIPLISNLPPTLKVQVQDAFLQGFKHVWIAFATCSAIGLLSICVMKNYPLKKTVDGKWGIDREREKKTANNP